MDWLAGAIEFCGVYLVGNRNRYGFLLNLSCNGLWIYVAYRSGVYGLIPVSLLMAVVNVRNFAKWTMEKQS